MQDLQAPQIVKLQDIRTLPWLRKNYSTTSYELRLNFIQTMLELRMETLFVPTNIKVNIK